MCLQCYGMRELSSAAVLKGGVTSAGEAFNSDSAAQPFTRLYVLGWHCIIEATHFLDNHNKLGDWCIYSDVLNGRVALLMCFQTREIERREENQRKWED